MRSPDYLRFTWMSESYRRLWPCIDMSFCSPTVGATCYALFWPLQLRYLQIWNDVLKESKKLKFFIHSSDKHNMVEEGSSTTEEILEHECEWRVWSKKGKGNTEAGKSKSWSLHWLEWNQNRQRKMVRIFNIDGVVISFFLAFLTRLNSS